MAIQVGSPAPPFTTKSYLHSSDSFKQISLHDYQGKWLCLYFFSLSFSPVCRTEVSAFDAARPDFLSRNCELLACSTDSHYVHKAWCETEAKLDNLAHPILSDLTQQISMDYGVLIPERGVALRGTFLIEPNGILRWLSLNDLRTGRNVASVLREFDAMQTGELCPCNWQRGDPPLTA